jgi:pimeloyl-ACP methyl ester carboxylesterase
MRLAVTESGSGPRTAVLIHGIMSDSRAWHRVTGELERRGFRVLAVDLAGHGRSPRARRYSPSSWAGDVAETIEPMLTGRRPDVIMGHSLGGLVASIVADRLAPRTAVYVDPAFAFPRGIRGVAYKLAYLLSPRPPRSALVRFNPKWSAEDVDIELATLRDWDRRTLLGFADTRPLVPPARLVAPSLRRHARAMARPHSARHRMIGAAAIEAAVIDGAAIGGAAIGTKP